MDILCFTHLRWDFVYQRPQHLLSRFAKEDRVFVIEEPVFNAPSEYYDIYQDPECKAWIVTPHLLSTTVTPEEISAAQRSLLDLLIESMEIRDFMAWYYSPMALSYSNHLKPAVTVYDCMDELSNFRFAPPALKQYESMLFDRADVVFTGGHHLYEAKQYLHHNIHPFPSSIDKQHFMQAREPITDPADQAMIPHPRIGFYGVIDERFNASLLDGVASQRPEWHFVVLGPVVKIDPETLPKRENIHFPGGKDYRALPSYLAGWDVAMMPFALNEATKYISPTKTPEFLAGGKPVVSTSIRDVVVPYSREGLVKIADTVNEFVAAIDEQLSMTEEEKKEWLQKVDEFLKDNSWDHTYTQMRALVIEALERKKLNVNINKQREAYV